ncbi:hypothetical protein U1Q18_051099, partial [Sarracenia purpurea var. burkii]
LLRCEDDLDDSRPQRNKRKLSSVDKEPYSLSKKKSFSNSPLASLAPRRICLSLESQPTAESKREVGQFIKIGAGCSATCSPISNLECPVSEAMAMVTTEAPEHSPTHMLEDTSFEMSSLFIEFDEDETITTEIGSRTVVSKETIFETPLLDIGENEDDAVTTEIQFEEAKLDGEQQFVTTVSKTVADADTIEMKLCNEPETSVPAKDTEPDEDGNNCSIVEPFDQDSLVVPGTSVFHLRQKELYDN